MAKATLDRLRDANEPLTWLTCYDYLTARVMDEVEDLDAILVGDSLGMVELGHDSTLPVTMEDMIHHTSAVARGVENTFLVADLPFLEAGLELGEVVKSVRKLFQQAGAQAVKIEGGARNIELIEHLSEHDVPVIGHLGLTPQSVEALGGYKIQGKRRDEIQRIGRDARALEAAGIEALVLECVPAEVADELTGILEIPTIGIGAGKNCDGQVLVWQDMMGLTEEEPPKFVRKWGDMRKQLREGVSSFCKAVRNNDFPASEESFGAAGDYSREKIRSLLLKE